MIVGFTGTQRGMSDSQMIALEAIIAGYDVTEFHHGDCVGADAQAHRLVRRLSPTTEIHVHPCTIDRKRAHCDADVIYDVKHPLARNHDIVNACQVLIVAPATDRETLRSGTWATWRYARSISRRIRKLAR